MSIDATIIGLTIELSFDASFLANRAIPVMMQIEQLIDEFDRNWREGHLPSIQTFLSQVPESHRQETLRELVALDLEYRWRSDLDNTANRLTRTDWSDDVDAREDASHTSFTARPLVEDYLAQFPGLNQPEIPTDLIAEEYRVRHRWGDQPEVADYTRRFGEREELLEALHEVMRELQQDAADTEDQEGDAEAEIETIRDEQASHDRTMRKIGRYRLIKMVGRGGMGEVWLAYDEHLQRNVALKLPRLRQAGADYDRRFINEARSAATLRHPGICPVYDAGEVDGQFFLTMAYIEGVTLWDHFQAQRSRESQPNDVGDARQRDIRIAEIFAGIATAVQAAHEAGIVHRDLKPTNVLIDSSGLPVVTDFGLAVCEWSSADTRITQTGSVFGSPAYMSPEQVLAAKNITATTDIYSLGVTLFRILTGELPFSGSAGNIMAGILRDLPPRPSRIQPDVDAELEQLCLWMLEKQPADRPESMRDVAGQLESVAVRLKSGRSAPLGIRLKPYLTSPYFLSSAGVSLVLICAAIWAWYPAEKSRNLPTANDPSRLASQDSKTTKATKYGEASASPQKPVPVFERPDQVVPGNWEMMFRGTELSGWELLRSADATSDDEEDVPWEIDEYGNLGLNPFGSGSDGNSENTSVPVIATTTPLTDFDLQIDYVAYPGTRHLIYPICSGQRLRQGPADSSIACFITIDELSDAQPSGTIVSTISGEVMSKSQLAGSAGPLRRITIRKIGSEVEVWYRPPNSYQIDDKILAARYEFSSDILPPTEPGHVAIEMVNAPLNIRMMRIRSLEAKEAQ